MTLHEAIELILQESGKSMTSRQIADVINERELYARRDGKLVSASQVTSRVNNYEKIFAKDLNKIKLLKDDIVSLKFQKYRNEISHSFNSKKYHSEGGRIQFLIQSLDDLEHESESDQNDFNISEPTAYYEGVAANNKLKIGYRLCNWFLSQDSNFRTIFTESFNSVLSGLRWFEKGHHKIMSDTSDSIHFMLKIAGDNPKATFTVHNKEIDKGGHNEDLFVGKINRHVEQLINNNYNNTQRVNSVLLTTGIIIPPFYRRLNNNISYAFESILPELNSLKPRFEKIILIVPAGVLSSSNKREVDARRKIIESGYLDTVILFPNNMIENSGVNLAMLIVDFEKQNSDIFFIDTSEILKDNIKAIVDAINNKTNIKDISNLVSSKVVNTNRFNLFPRQFVFNPEEIEVRRGYTQYSIKDLIEYSKSGGRFKSRNSLYSGGEYKLIRTSDITKDSLFFESKSTMLGVDHDELTNDSKNLIKDGIVVSGFNKKIKSAVLPSNETFALGQDVYWLYPNKKIVLAEFLVKEFSKEYVTKQVQYYSKGSTISRLYLKDLLTIQIQVPSLEEQKEIIFKEFRSKGKQIKNEDIKDEEFDFIKTLKHSLKQPAAGLGNDFSSLKSFLSKKISNSELLIDNESIVPVFESDTNEQIKMHTLSNTLDRMARAISDIDYILDQAVQVISISEPKKENIEFKTFLQNFISEYSEIAIKVTGIKVDILADKKQLRILIHNFINNAIKHGFKEKIQNPTIWLEIKPKDTLSIQLSIRNNGKKLPPEFTIEDFLAKGGSLKKDVGSGFGGFLIGQIIKKHNGKIALNTHNGFGILPHNVEFLITLPK